MTRFSTPRLIVALAISVVGLLASVMTGTPEAALLAAPWLVLLVLGLSHSTPPTARVEVSLGEERVIVGDEVQVGVRVVVSTDGIADVTVDPEETFWAGQPDGSKPRASRRTKVEAVVSDRVQEFVFSLEAAAWGTHDLGRAHLAVTAPYGLFRSTGSITRPARLRVHPTPSQIQELLTPWMVRRVSGAHRSSESARGVEYADIRPFAAGDSLRDINWRASARSEELRVSQRHPDRSTDVILFLDSFVESGHDVRTVFGAAIEAAIALAESHLGLSDRVGLIEFGGLIRWVNPGTGALQLQRITDALLATGLFANAAEKELPLLARGILPPRSFVVALTPLLDDRFVEALYALRGRGHDVGVIECVPFIPAAQVQDASESVSLRLWLANRQMLRDQLVARGAAVVQWHPGSNLDLSIRELLRRRRAIKAHV